MADDIQTGDARAMRYSTTAAVIHWLSAALIIAQIWLGFTFEDFPKGSPERALYFDSHKTIGVAILLLALLRLAVRLTQKSPPYPAGTPAWHSLLATWGHRLLYVLMIALPLTGLMLVSKGGATTGLLGGLSFPTIPLPELGEAHEVLAFGMIGLLVIHVLAGLSNQFMDGGRLAGRMPPFSRKG